MTFPDPLSALFYSAVGVRNRFYDNNWLKSVRVPGPRVVCVGNIAVGGRGKTPLAAAICEMGVAAGKKTCLVSRGYGGRHTGAGVLVSNGDGPLVEPGVGGDEAQMCAARYRGFSILVGRDRVAQVERAAGDGAALVVLDDGFQHRRLARDVDIVCIHPDDLAKGARMLPVGHLREPRLALQRATCTAGYETAWRDRQDSPPILFRLVPDKLIDQQERTYGVDQMPHRVHVLCGVAHPERVLETVQRLGRQVTGTTFLPDHARLTGPIVKVAVASAQQRGAGALLLTAKDFYRQPLPDVSFPILALLTRTEIRRGLGLLQTMLAD